MAATEARPRARLASTTFQVHAGEFVCIVGPSGCGKSTLLRILGGLLRPTRGHVYLQGQELTEPRPEIGYVFQHANLMPWRTVLQNVALPLQLQKLPKREVEERAKAAVALVGLEGFEFRLPAPAFRRNGATSCISPHDRARARAVVAGRTVRRARRNHTRNE